jgi:uncharacterized membrane protein
MQKEAGLKLIWILALAALLRFGGLGVKQLWFDEILQVLHSRPDSMREILVSVTQDRGGAPLDYLIQHVCMANLSGPIQWTARFHAALFGVLAVLLIYLVCQELFIDQRLSLMCALLFCFYPFHHHYSQEGRPYSLFLLLTLVLYFFLLRSLKRNTWSLWGCFAAVAIMAFYTHAYASIVLFAQLLFLIYHQILQRENWPSASRRGAGFLVSSILAVAAYLPWLLYSFFNAKGDAPPEINFRLLFQMIKGLGDGSYPLALALILCAVAGIHCLIRTQRLLELGALLIWFIAPLPVILAILTWRNYFFSERQLLFVAPPFLILAAVGIDHLKQKVTLRYFFPEIILILISVVVIALHYQDSRDDIRAVGQSLKDAVRPTDKILTPGLTDVLSFYFPDISHYSADSLSPRDLLQASDTSRIIYVDSRFNRNRLRMNTLLMGLRQSDEIRFRGITVYIFSFRNRQAAPVLRTALAEKGNSMVPGINLARASASPAAVPSLQATGL